jgi:hypothetical protein
MTLAENTFGETPGAMYLVRTLNEINNATLNRSVGRSITSCTTAVNDLVQAVEGYALKPKTAANTLRLMREEVTNDYSLINKYPLVLQLSKNVRIGAIKRAMLLCTVSRKAEHVMNSYWSKGIPTCVNPFMSGDVTVDYKFKDSITGKLFDAGFVRVSLADSTGPTIEEVVTNGPSFAEVNEGSIERLQQKSWARCKRQGKAHTL